MSRSLRVTSVRVARDDDLDLLQDIEDQAGRALCEALSERGATAAFGPSPTGAERARRPGVLLVTGDPVVGFAHVLEVGGGIHLHELAVLPQFHRQGVGTGLLRAAMGWALDHGANELTLSTYTDVPFNAPFYARHGFEVVAPGPQSYLRRIRDDEFESGIERFGDRVAMRRPLSDTPVPMPAVSVIPLRDSPAGLQAFVQYRVDTMDFAPGAVVFPGGRVDAADRLVPAPVPPNVAAAHADRWATTSVAGDPVQAAILVVAAVRELAEETGVFADPAALVPWDNWITPVDVPRRFDVHFFVLPVQGEQHDFRNTTTEAHTSEWVSLNVLAAQAEAHEIHLLPPTRTIVDELTSFACVGSVLTARPAITAIRHDLIGPRPRPPG